MSRSIELHLGVTGAFCARRWEQPASWIRLTAELGFGCHELCSDALDPFFSGDRDFQLAQAREARQAAQDHGVHILGVGTGLAASRFHGLSHSDPIPRQRMVEWVVACMDIACALGADRVGGHWDAIPVETIQEGDHAYNLALRRQQGVYRELAEIAADKGLSALYLEQTCVPSRPPWTLKQAEQFLIEVNRNRSGCPVYLCVNVGNMAGMHYGLAGRDLDYREWLRALGPFCEVIHLQQTTPDTSAHWPFTETYNQRGHIRVEQVLEALQQGHQQCGESWVSEVLEPTPQHWLVVDYVPPSIRPERVILEELTATAEHLKQYLPEGKLTLQV